MTVPATVFTPMGMASVVTLSATVVLQCRGGQRLCCPWVPFICATYGASARHY
ncbi:hypothetical protein PR003_g18212 [Phytophthora rubi]|uniref:Uncharacterized protein n=1 Tax=Phytophthora rubi TaxID=129364 RepID=A0A6A3K4H0_9STRA|nr:hypothetical protein PR002_g17600 [Phytophthora rubi]KAE9005956.1 hypothetical protein PR001_g17322 [Phytophthora rubi]KAE9318520.1 hypothetical protein PR003_g18212 [Phytophthora rubi]